MVITLHNVITLKPTKYSNVSIITLHSIFITLLDWLHYTQITLHPTKRNNRVIDIVNQRIVVSLFVYVRI